MGYWPLGVEPALFIVSFCGGVLGAALGPLLVFTFTGVAVLLGEFLLLAGVSFNLTGSLAFGAILGPHVSFGGGAAALAYAVAAGYQEDRDFHYHQAKEVTVGLGARWDTLLVGGVFGSFGYFTALVFRNLSFPFDPIAGGVVLSAFVHRWAFGYTVFGVPGLDGCPERHETWLPYQTRWVDVSVLSVAMGVIGSYLTYLTASPFVGFGLSTSFLVFLCAGVDNVPVTHHMTLPAGTALLAYQGTGSGSVSPGQLQSMVSLEQMLLIGAIFGLIGGISGEVCQRLFYEQSETHLDPPAAGIVLSTTFISMLVAVGILESTVWIPG